MKNILSRCWNAIFPVPEVGAIEATIARSLFAWAMWSFYPVFIQHTAQPEPVGLAHWFDLTWMHDNAAYGMMRSAFAVALIAYAAGVALPLVLPALAIMHILPWTLHNSQGYTFHANQIMSLSLLGQTVTVWWMAARKRAGWLHPTGEASSWLLFNTQFVIAAAYLISVCSKMYRSDGEWLQNSYYVALDFVKTMRQNYYSGLDPQYAVDPPLVAWFMEHPLTAAIMFDFGVFLEAFMILAIGSRKWTFLFGASLIVMHLSIAKLMNLFFPTHLWMLVIYWVNLPFLVSIGLGWVWQRFRPGQPALATA